ncbi:hypothetical protein [Pseudomonas abietaniphila]|uniref:hypothetical protein n=1 Tax=Pseudomonas abietaniphila TaxID=89065 RepID=UPI0007812165|nr:hypothetical protein [Pseudomonas abietaniphila]
MTTVVNTESLATLDLNELKARLEGWSPPEPPTDASLEGTGWAILQYDEKPAGDYVAGEIREEDGKFIQGWAEAELSADEIAKRYELAVQTELDRAAQARGYDSLFTAISYADEPAVPRFQADGQAFRRWRSLVWDYAHTELNAVLAGEKPHPDLDTFLAEMPTLSLH